MTNRNDENRERFEGARGQDAGRQQTQSNNNQNRGNRQENWFGSPDRWRGNQESYGDSQGRNMNQDFQDSEDWRNGDDAPYGSDQNSYGNQGWMGGNQPGNQRGWETNQGSYGQNSGWGGNQGSGGNSGNTSGGRRGYSDSRQGGMRRGMSPNFNRQNEWSSNHGVGGGLGGAESSEYSNSSPAGSYYGTGTDQMRGGSMGSGFSGGMSGGMGQYGGGLSQYGEQGQHSGRGPKGYKRSDERIREDVNERLTHDAHIDAGDIEVNVKDGEVTLTGMVDGRHTKRRAEDVIENVSGVREIHNQLRVKTGQDNGNAVGMTTGSNKQSQQNKETAGSGSSKT